MIYRELDQAIGAVHVSVDRPARSILSGLLNITLAVLGYHTTPVARLSSLSDRSCYLRDQLSLGAALTIYLPVTASLQVPQGFLIASTFSAPVYLEGPLFDKVLSLNHLEDLASHSYCVSKPRPPTAVG